MRKLIIICSNNAQTGKTTALQKVGVLLSRKYPIMHIKGSLDERVTEDVRAVFKIGDVCVGLETLGDNQASEIQRDSLWDFVKEQHCAIVITSSRMRCETRYNIEQFIEEFDYDAVWMSHDYTRIERLRETLNERYAERVVQYVEEWIHGKIK